MSTPSAPTKLRQGNPETFSRPTLEKEVALVPGTLAIRFNISVSGHANNYLVNNVSRALVSRMEVFFGGEPLQDTNQYDLYKVYENLFLPLSERNEGFLEGTQSHDLNKICSSAGKKKHHELKETDEAERRVWQ